MINNLVLEKTTQLLMQINYSVKYVADNIEQKNMLEKTCYRHLTQFAIVSF